MLRKESNAPDASREMQRGRHCLELPAAPSASRWWTQTTLWPEAEGREARLGDARLRPASQEQGLRVVRYELAVLSHPRRNRGVSDLNPSLSSGASRRCSTAACWLCALLAHQAGRVSGRSGSSCRGRPESSTGRPAASPTSWAALSLLWMSTRLLWLVQARARQRASPFALSRHPAWANRDGPLLCAVSGARTAPPQPLRAAVLSK